MEVLSSPELASQLSALGQVLMIDLVLAGDNAVAVGLAAAALPQEQRRKAILVGLAFAVLLRIGSRVSALPRSIPASSRCASCSGGLYRMPGK